MKSSAFPYFGNNPRSEAPFLNIAKGDRRGHRSYSGKVYWQDETYNDSRVLVHVPEHFNARKPGVIVVFFHGNGATLERDVRDRQMVPQQISDSGVNAVLLAPQLAVDAADSSAGKFWQPNGFKRFMDESTAHLARLYGDPNSAKAFANMPIVIVGYSGGFLPTAWSLEVGGITNRVRGVFLLDAVYGELDKFASWIENNRSGFFVSSYTRYTKRHDKELMAILREKGINYSEDMNGPLRPGSVVFVQTPDGITHRDYVTQAWTEHPVKDVLVKMAATPALTRVASAPYAASRSRDRASRTGATSSCQLALRRQLGQLFDKTVEAGQTFVLFLDGAALGDGLRRRRLGIGFGISLGLRLGRNHRVIAVQPLLGRIVDFQAGLQLGRHRLWLFRRGL
jgi:hypothetical protein